jgi:hypothetical protein
VASIISAVCVAWAPTIFTVSVVSGILLPLFLLPLLTTLECLLWLGSLLLLASPAVVGVRLCSSSLLAVGLAVDVFLPQLLLL